ncbi:MAG: DNA recombination protein RmuC [Pseudorhodoplanes sp.]|nr:DNA recombination protein RmuC [Pseudorhodoplanes sp.]
MEFSDQISALLRDPVFVAAATGAAGVAILAGGVWLIGLAVRAARRRREEAHAAQERMMELAHLQAETAGRVRAMSEMLHAQHAELQRAVNARLDAVTHHLGQSMQATTRQTTDNLQKLNERLAVIDTAQKNITQLASEVTSLQGILSNKQQRGAFGQGRMEIIVRDGLPASAYEFQFTLSNRTRPDCAIFLPDQRPLIIDAKFPLEAMTALRDARTDEERKFACARVRQDVLRHVNDIAEKYLLPGETHELALMFVPSESVYADLHDGFDDLIQKAFRARVVVVSPSLLMLAIQVIQQIQRDARMREAAELIRNEVELLSDDLSRLRDRVVKLEKHFGQANEDIRQILVSADKIDKRAGKIRELEFEGADDIPSGVVIPAPIARRLEAGE